MTESTGHQDYPGRVSEVVLRPHYDTANTRLRVGTRGLTALAEEAVVHWFRVRKLSPAVLLERFGLEFSIIDCSSLAFGVAHLDDEITASAQPVGSRYFNVRLSVGDRRVLQSRITVVMPRVPGRREELPEELTGMAIDEFDRIPTAVDTHDPEFEARDLDERITNDALGWFRSWRVPVSGCHYDNRMQYSGHLRILDELAELFAADRGLPARQTLLEHGLVPVMPRVRLRLLADAYAGDLVHTTYEVHQVVGGACFDCRFDAHVQRGDRRIPVATGILLSAYAREDDRAGKPVPLPTDIIEAMTGPGTRGQRIEMHSA
ncbi:hypothetical protein ACN28C_19325 [Plantactinospora sp. WMMC1484]|uniref:hypothetical protein n=1 Tax=Plantactinospora sp. WMMC1484 TaxID=3404122 RepID=UPI003BF49A54